MRHLLRDETLGSPQDMFATRQTLPSGPIQAILKMIRRLGLDGMIAAQRCRQRLAAATAGPGLGSTLVSFGANVGLGILTCEASGA